MTIELHAVPTAEPTPPLPVDRSLRRATARAFRPRRVVPALVVGAVLAVGATLAAIEIISRLAHHRVAVLPVGWLAHFGTTTDADNVRFLVIAGVLAALGLILVALAFWPGRRRVVGLATSDRDAVVGITYAGMSRQLARAAETVDGIARAKVAIGRRRVAVHAASPLRDVTGLKDQVRSAVSGRLAEFAPLRDRKIYVAVRRRED